MYGDWLMVVTLDGSCTFEAVKMCRCMYGDQLMVVTLDGSCSYEASEEVQMYVWWLVDGSYARWQLQL